MIKKSKFLVILIFILHSKTNALSPEYEKEMYIGCYGNSKVYLGPEKAKKYCSCTVKMLSEKFSNQEIDLIFKKEQKEIIKATEFASTYCEKNFQN